LLNGFWNLFLEKKLKFVKRISKSISKKKNCETDIGIRFRKVWNRFRNLFLEKKIVVVVDVVEGGVKGSVKLDGEGGWAGGGLGEAHGEDGEVGEGGDEKGEAFAGGAGGRGEDGEGEAGGEGDGGVGLGGQENRWSKE